MLAHNTGKKEKEKKIKTRKQKQSAHSTQSEVDVKTIHTKEKLGHLWLLKLHIRTIQYWQIFFKKKEKQTNKKENWKQHWNDVE